MQGRRFWQTVITGDGLAVGSLAETAPAHLRPEGIAGLFAACVTVCLSGMMWGCPPVGG